MKFVQPQPQTPVVLSYSPESGHWSVGSKCPQSARSRHRASGMFSNSEAAN